MLILDNATVPYNSHRTDKSHVWFIPCRKAAILLNTNNKEDYVTFKFLKINKDQYKNYTDPECCNTYLILLG
jgi:hypothetical protein